MLFVLILIVTICLYFFLHSKITFWQRKGIPTLPTTNLLFGDIIEVILYRQNACLALLKAYNYFQNNGYKYGGIYIMTTPAFLIVDPSLLGSVLISDFDHWTDRAVYSDPENDPLSGHILALKGEEWKYIRQKMTPSFSIAKLKRMYQLMEPHVDIMCNVIEKESKCNDALDVYEILEKLGIDIIGHIALGLECNTLENQNEEFATMAHKIFRPKLSNLMKAAIQDGGNILKSVTRTLTSNKKMCSYFLELMHSTKTSRETKSDIKHNDFFQSLIELTKTTNGPLTFNQIAAEAFAFFVAAFETPAKTVQFALYELCKNMDLQQQIRNELNKSCQTATNVLNNDFVKTNLLLDLVVKETLRKHSPIMFVSRVCTKDYQVPHSSIVLEKGTYLLIPTYAMHNNEKYFPNPDVFDPYRFSLENKDNIMQYTYLPFGDGPRNCIGFKYGTMQVKLTLAKILQRFKVDLNPKTIEPLEISPITSSSFLAYKNKIYFDFKKI